MLDCADAPLCSLMLPTPDAEVQLSMPTWRGHALSGQKHGRVVLQWPLMAASYLGYACSFAQVLFLDGGLDLGVELRWTDIQQLPAFMCSFRLATCGLPVRCLMLLLMRSTLRIGRGPLSLAWFLCLTLGRMLPGRK